MEAGQIRDFKCCCFHCSLIPVPAKVTESFKNSGNFQNGRYYLYCLLVTSIIILLQVCGMLDFCF